MGHSVLEQAVRQNAPETRLCAWYRHDLGGRENQGMSALREHRLKAL